MSYEWWQARQVRRKRRKRRIAKLGFRARVVAWWREATANTDHPRT